MSSLSSGARPLWRAMACLGLAVLTACGGGGSSSDSSSGAGGSGRVAATPPTRTEAARFLTQATFGPTDADVDAVVAQGYAAWLDAQFAKAPSVNYLSYWDARNTALGGTAVPGNYKAGQREVMDMFWKQAIAGDDQLRARVAFALSQIFVISMVDSSVAFRVRGAASYMDMLNAKAFGSYRDLLESVSLHPMMGLYLTSLHNQKENLKTGRVPDENYAREVMQLFSIGLVQLNADGTPKLSGGATVPTYTPSDISGLAKVFTGWSWACPVQDDNCFYGGTSKDGETDVDKDVKPMRSYPQFHSSTAKTFLGVTIADQGSNADPVASLKTALDTLAAHPNVGPFLARQLIQRLVTSNPSPAYVSRAAAAFTSSGGSLQSLVKAILLDTEARSASTAATASFGKLREPVLRLSATLRALGATSDSGGYLVGNTDNPGTQLGQSVLRSPSVFNFYRPGYVPPGGSLAKSQLVAPEMQITHETSVAGYVNYMSSVINSGVGQAGYDGKATRRDLQPAYLLDTAHPLRTLAASDTDVPTLVDQVGAKLIPGGLPAGLKDLVVTGVKAIPVPAVTATNQAAVDAAKLNRVKAAILLTVASPEFSVQK